MNLTQGRISGYIYDIQSATNYREHVIPPSPPREPPPLLPQMASFQQSLIPGFVPPVGSQLSRPIIGGGARPYRHVIELPLRRQGRSRWESDIAAEAAAAAVRAAGVARDPRRRPVAAEGEPRRYGSPVSDPRRRPGAATEGDGEPARPPNLPSDPRRRPAAEPRPYYWCGASLPPDF